MRLQDEYIQRHNLKVNPIYHVRNANLILKSQPQIVLNIQWKDSVGRPGFYIFDYLNPNHNGYLDGNYFLTLGERHYYQYDEYAGFLKRWVKNLNFIPIKSSEVKLAVWEMFLYCFDGWIAEHNLEEMAFKATDSCLSQEERCTGIDAFFYHLELYDPLILEIYNSEFKQYEYNYADWLVELIQSFKGVNNAKP